MRWTHIIRKNKTSETPQRAFIITLTKSATQRSHGGLDYCLKGGTGLHLVRKPGESEWRSTWYHFRTKTEFWDLVDLLTKRKTRTYCCIDGGLHTLGLLDVFTLGFRRGWKWTKIVLQGPPIIVQGRKDSRTILFLDVANFWDVKHLKKPTPTKSRLTKSFASSTSTATSGWIGAIEWLNFVNNKKHGVLTDAVRQRLVVKTTARLWQGWWDFLRKNDLGGFANTIGSQSVRVYRHRWMHASILVDCNPEALRLARAAYKGGRTECFYVGRASGRYHLLDINSHYAAVMREMEVPVRLRGYTQNAGVDDLHRWVQRHVVITDVTLETRSPVFAVREEGKLIFPVGRFRTTLAADEVPEALAGATITDVHQAALYDHEPAFRDYMVALWDFRQAAERAGDLEDVEKWKMLMRSFYGKWGQHGGVWETIEHTSSDAIKSWVDIDYHTSETTEYRQFGGVIQVLRKDPESGESVPAIASSITANGRMWLWRLIQKAGVENVLYCDTDSLLTNDEGRARLEDEICPFSLGGLRQVGMFTELRIHGAKDYVLDSRQRRKGVRDSSHVESNGTIQQLERQSFAEQLMLGDISHAATKMVRRSFKRSYDKGVISADGRVTPFRKD